MRPQGEEVNQLSPKDPQGELSDVSFQTSIDQSFLMAAGFSGSEASSRLLRDVGSHLGGRSQYNHSRRWKCECRFVSELVCQLRHLSRYSRPGQAPA